MKMKDVVSVVQTAVAQAMGAEFMEKQGNLTGLASDKLVDIGTAIENAGTSETVFKGLITQLALLEVEARAYSGDLNSFMVKDTEWGGFV